MVGKSTVSRVLNNEKRGVSERTRERVEAVMNQHGFPSRSARAMRGQSDKVVAIIVTAWIRCLKTSRFRPCCLRFGEQGYDPGYDGKPVLADAGNGTSGHAQTT